MTLRSRYQASIRRGQAGKSRAPRSPIGLPAARSLHEPNDALFHPVGERGRPGACSGPKTVAPVSPTWPTQRLQARWRHLRRERQAGLFDQERDRRRTASGCWQHAAAGPPLPSGSTRGLTRTAGVGSARVSTKAKAASWACCCSKPCQASAHRMGGGSIVWLENEPPRRFFLVRQQGRLGRLAG